MTENQLKRDLCFLISKYVDDEDLAIQLISTTVNEEQPGVKGILHEITKSARAVDPGDSDKIKDIAFHFV